VECSVMVVSSMSPAPVSDLRAALEHHPFAVTIEAHYAIGGLGSLVCETVAEHNIDCRVVRCGVTRNPSGEQGDQAFMNRLHGLSPEHIAMAVLGSRRLLAEKAMDAESTAGQRISGFQPDWGAIRDPEPKLTPKIDPNP
jgi:deoxyxylulose-5-phosphate synthase